jgi:phosphotriesterase-related protein
MDALSVRDLETLLVREVQEGVDGTHWKVFVSFFVKQLFTIAKAGVIGELGTSWPISENERKVLTAAAKACARTGACINIHPGRHEDAPFECVKIIREAVGSEILPRVIVSHIDRTLFDTEKHCNLARAGVVLEFGKSAPLKELNL